jgi:hypothetical protein
LVRENPAGTAAWSTVDTFEYSPNQESAPAAIAADALANVFVGGFGVDASGIVHWLGWHKLCVIKSGLRIRRFQVQLLMGAPFAFGAYEI